MTALSGNAAKALQQAKLSLSMLYGADYFTEEEWIQIDGLLHKGRYVFTSGPAIPTNNPLEDGPLLNFENADSLPLPSSTMAFTSSTEKKSAITVTEQRIPSPISEELSDETAGETAGGSSDGDHPHTILKHAHNTSLFDLSEMITPAEGSVAERAAPSAEASISENPNRVQLDVNAPITELSPAQNTVIETPIVEETIAEHSPAEGPITEETFHGALVGEDPTQPAPPKFSQEQLDMVRAFNASLTKAGQKKRPKYSKQDYPSPEWSEESQGEDGAQHPYSERGHDIQSWAQEVRPEEPSPISSPSTPQLVQQFIEAHGRNPKNLNDISQPNNPQFRPKRPESKASTRTARSTNKSVSTPSLKAPPSVKDVFSPGKVFTALSSHRKKSEMQIDVHSGDSIRYIKAVSGIMHRGENLRTKETGQFPETILVKVAGALTSNPILEQQRAAVQNHGRQRVLSLASRQSNELDTVEGMNAREWDEVPLLRSRTAAPAPMRTLGGLSASRFAVLSDLDSKSQTTTSEQTEGQSVSREEVSKMVDERIARIVAAQQHVASRTTSGSGSVRGRVTGTAPLNIPPKKETCWFWANHKEGCRFEADQCRDLHAYVPSGPGEPANFHRGRPTWGALADSLPPTTRGFSDPTLVSKNKGLTCWYWARNGSCENTAADCKYLHADSPIGVAHRPWTRLSLERSRRKIERQDESPAQEEDNQWGNIDEIPAWDTPTPAARENPTETPSWDTPAGTPTPGKSNEDTTEMTTEGKNNWGVSGDSIADSTLAQDQRAKMEALGW